MGLTEQLHGSTLFSPMGYLSVGKLPIGINKFVHSNCQDMLLMVLLSVDVSDVLSGGISYGVRQYYPGCAADKQSGL